jgi:hypothetical protein
VLAASAQASDLYVNPALAACSDTASLSVASHAATPWCSPLPATRSARPGDTVHLASATYHVQMRPATSGTAARPITYIADGAVTIAPPDASVGVMVSGVHDIVVRGVPEAVANVVGATMKLHPHGDASQELTHVRPPLPSIRPLS